MNYKERKNCMLETRCEPRTPMPGDKRLTQRLPLVVTTDEEGWVHERLLVLFGINTLYINISIHNFFPNAIF